MASAVACLPLKGREKELVQDEKLRLNQFFERKNVLENLFLSLSFSSFFDQLKGMC